jgi:uncharacterized protein YjbI with pentapeptide repeats
MSDGDVAAIVARLEGAPPAVRLMILETMIASHPEGRLHLPGDENRRPDLGAMELSEVRWRQAVLCFANLQGADLTDSHLASADLRGAALDHADLSRADLSGADLSGAGMGETVLADALLEDANLDRVSLRFANLRGAILEGSRLTGADLWGAVLEGADLSDTAMRGALAGEVMAAGADLSRADLRDTDWTGARLSGATLVDADLRGAVLKGADLRGASLAGAQLQEVSLTTCELAGAHWADARLSKTRMKRGQLGPVVGEEAERKYEAAGQAYLALERNFIELGDPGAASWAYRRRRRMEKFATRGRAATAARNGHMIEAAIEGIRFCGDQLVEWICDYGESISRVFLTLAVVFTLFTVLYGVTGSVLRAETGPQGQQLQVVTRDPVDLAIFSLMAMTTSGLPTITLTPVNVYVNILTGFQALFGIFLTGLLGFVAGARIRR